MSDIVHEDPAVFPFGPHKGKETTTVLAVLYEDGSTGYRCGECSYTADTFGSVFAHRSGHTVRAPRGDVVRTKEDIVADIVAMLGALLTPDEDAAALKQELANERAARKTAEKKLSTLRSLLKGE